ncbi:MAG: hypothetical protein WDW38_009440 [Sanguina aurantia]
MGKVEKNLKLEDAITRMHSTLSARRPSMAVMGDAEAPVPEEIVDEVHMQMLMWTSFAAAWDEIIDDLRHSDYVNDKEVTMLKFVRLHLGNHSHGLRPILLPTFFYAGQTRKVVDTGQVTVAQAMVLSELQMLSVWLASQVGLLSGKQVHVITSAPFSGYQVNVKHGILRKRTFNAALKLMGQLQDICLTKEVPFDMVDIADVVCQIWTGLEGEAHAIQTLLLQGKCTKVEAELAGYLLEVAVGVRELISRDPEGLKKSLKEALHNNATANWRELSRVISEAQRILGFFVNSLAHPSLDEPPSLIQMGSWSILTPLYEEDVLYALDAKYTAMQLKLPVRKLNDLLTESDDSIALMTYLKVMFPQEWENFKERIKKLEPSINLATVSEHDFAPGCQLHDYALDLQFWASQRGQLLARTVHGMMLAEKGLRVLAKLEYPMPTDMSELDYKKWVDKLVGSKFEYVVAPQTYGKNRISKDVKLRWHAQSLDILMQRYPTLKVSFLDDGETEAGQVEMVGGGGARSIETFNSRGSMCLEVFTRACREVILGGEVVCVGAMEWVEADARATATAHDTHPDLGFRSGGSVIVM